MADCFETIIGLSDRDCDCFATGRPEGDSAMITESRMLWYPEKFTCPDSPPDPYTITSTYSLPEEQTIASLQLFGGGQLLEVDVDFSVTGVNEITVLFPIPGQVYQLLYVAKVPTAVTVPAYSQSDSGLFITDLLPEEEIAGLAKCDKTLWGLMIKARSIGIGEFRAVLNSTMIQRYKAKYNTYKGFIGDDKGSDRLTSSYGYAGQRIRTSGIRSGYLKITRIMAMFQQTGTLLITIYKGRVINENTGEMEMDVVVPAFSINTTGGGRAITSVDINLPLLGDFAQEQDYIIAYEYSGTNKPMLNKTFCQPCNGNVYINRNVSTYALSQKGGYTGKAAFHNFITIGGWEGDISGGATIAPNEVGEYMNGLSLEVEIGCDMAAGLCSMIEGFGENPHARSAAMAIQRKAAAYLMRRRLSSSTPNRQNAVNREGVEAEMKRWEGEFAEIMQYLSSNMPETANDCLACNPRMRVGGIMG